MSSSDTFCPSRCADVFLDAFDFALSDSPAIAQAILSASSRLSTKERDCAFRASQKQQHVIRIVVCMTPPMCPGLNFVPTLKCGLAAQIHLI